MAWTHSLADCQSVLEVLSRKVAGVSAENALVDRNVAPVIDLMIHTEYADNFESYAYKARLVAEAAKGVEALLNDAGLPAHDVFVTKGGASLGWNFSAFEPILGVSVRSMWRLRLGLLEFARRGFGSGHQLEILVGHFTPRAILRRELLAGFGSTYTFIAKHRHHHLKLWPSVKRELVWAAHLESLSQRSLAAEWSPVVYCFDASFGIDKNTSAKKSFVTRQGVVNDGGLRGNTKIAGERATPTAIQLSVPP